MSHHLLLLQLELCVSLLALAVNHHCCSFLLIEDLYLLDENEEDESIAAQEEARILNERLIRSIWAYLLYQTRPDGNSAPSELTLQFRPVTCGSTVSLPTRPLPAPSPSLLASLPTAPLRTPSPAGSRASHSHHPPSLGPPDPLSQPRQTGPQQRYRDSPQSCHLGGFRVRRRAGRSARRVRSRPIAGPGAGVALRLLGQGRAGHRHRGRHHPRHRHRHGERGYGAGDSGGSAGRAPPGHGRDAPGSGRPLAEEPAGRSRGVLDGAVGARWCPAGKLRLLLPPRSRPELGIGWARSSGDRAGRQWCIWRRQYVSGATVFILHWICCGNAGQTTGCHCRDSNKKNPVCI